MGSLTLVLLVAVIVAIVQLLGHARSRENEESVSPGGLSPAREEKPTQPQQEAAAQRWQVCQMMDCRAFNPAYARYCRACGRRLTAPRVLRKKPTSSAALASSGFEKE